MGKRKKASLSHLVEAGNRLLRSEENTREFRSGVMTMLEMALLEAENYQGFRYITQAELPNQAPGINVDAQGAPEPGDARFAGCDPTRVQYYYRER